MPNYPGRRPKTRRVTLFVHGKQHEWIVEGSKRDGDQFLARMRLELAAKQPVAKSRGVPTFSDFCLQTYRPHAVVHLGDRTWRTVRKYQVATLTEHLGPVRVDALSIEHVDAFVRIRLADKMRPSSINNELRVLKTMLRWGREECGLPIPVLKIQRLKVGKRRVRAWSRDEVRRLYAGAREVAPPLVPLLHFLLDTGCRKGEAIAAEWSWLDLERRELRIPVTEHWRPKSGEAREVPLSDALLETLRALPRRHPRFIFPNVLGAPHACFPEKPWRKVLAKCSVTGGPHTARHTYASHFLAARPDLPLLASVLGHSTTYVTELYAHMLPEHLERARNAVQLAPPSKLWRPTLAKTKDVAKSTRKTSLRH